MTDVLTKSQRRFCMSRIRARDTKPELFIRKLAHSLGYRYRLHRKDLPGSPDIVFPKYKKVIFVHGCFWHGHPGCRKATLPATNTNFWKTKISDNIKRDAKNYDCLNNAGWDYMIIWQCEIKKGFLDRLSDQLKTFLS